MRVPFNYDSNRNVYMGKGKINLYKINLPLKTVVYGAHHIVHLFLCGTFFGLSEKHLLGVKRLSRSVYFPV